MGFVTDLLKEFPALSVAKERLALIEEKLKQVEAERDKLKTENETLRAKVASLEAEVAAATKASEFVEEMGVLWKRDASGKFPAICYCPKCKMVMSAGPDDMLLLPPRCKPCRITAPFYGQKGLQEIANRLNAGRGCENRPWGG